MSPFLAEFVGTAFIIIFGNGVVANVLLKDSKGAGGGWIVITLGWSMAVFIGVYTAAAVSGAHLNSAVTLALAAWGDFPWSKVPSYLIAQVCGAAAGQCVVWLTYRAHFNATEDPALQQACFCTAPAIRNHPQNFLTEALGTFVFMFAILYISKPELKLGALDALPVAFLVLAMGLSLGGPTGYAINPARDLGPRIMHALLPIKGKGSSGWGYAWVPILGPIAGASLAHLLYNLLN